MDCFTDTGQEEPHLHAESFSHRFPNSTKERTFLRHTRPASSCCKNIFMGILVFFCYLGTFFFFFYLFPLVLLFFFFVFLLNKHTTEMANPYSTMFKSQHYQNWTFPIAIFKTLQLQSCLIFKFFFVFSFRINLMF